MRVFLIVLLLSSFPCLAETRFEGGTGNLTTQKFSVNSAWRLHWDFQGSGLKVWVHHADTSRAVGKPIKQALDGTGSMDFQKPGTYYLKIKSVGDYTLRVEELARDNSTAGGSLPVFSGGTERKGTSIFTVPDKWGFRASSEGPVLKVTLYTVDRKQIGSPLVVLGGSSDRYVGPGGKYFMMIQAAGPYRIETYQR